MIVISFENYFIVLVKVLLILDRYCYAFCFYVIVIRRFQAILVKDLLIVISWVSLVNFNINSSYFGFEVEIIIKGLLFSCLQHLVESNLFHQACNYRIISLHLFRYDRRKSFCCWIFY